MDIRSNRRDADGESVITANRLLDGIVVWRDASGAWRECISDAARVPNAEVESLLGSLRNDTQAEGLVGIYGVQLDSSADDTVPLTAREKIRAFGPSVHPEFSPGTSREGAVSHG
ncbi:DUF2849 domain-containing protein [Acetobacter sp. AN02]|uniref:DUF2849 domain-containing protein n=1 Tax=Acetobacter sp. AN02 TaxID=2894186 RepID=UPI0024342F2D|nr:DUF2849 domain-containing protein [Acetobacter sp. AN02]MDG6094647.1 DUF2849 domain-containing protein [Acetobacter sp. AN02]